MTESLRLAKRLAELVPCSRREAEQYIEGGWVRVDGEMIEEPGFRVRAQQHVELMPLATLVPLTPVTILLHQPADYHVGDHDAMQLLTPDTLAADDRSVISFLKQHLVGLKLTLPLESKASGLLVFTQDWQIARKLVDDAATIEQEYIVEVLGNLVPDGLALLNHGLRWNGKPLPPIKVSWQNENRLRFAIKSPDRGQIAHMCAMVGLEIKAIKRIRIGRIPMAGLESGTWRYLLGYERF
jgi:23S rRNA pseudouridine2604 synthase